MKSRSILYFLLITRTTRAKDQL